MGKLKFKFQAPNHKHQINSNEAPLPNPSPLWGEGQGEGRLGHLEIESLEFIWNLACLREAASAKAGILTFELTELICPTLTPKL
jgi:hypothetical protein